MEKPRRYEVQAFPANKTNPTPFLVVRQEWSDDGPYDGTWVNVTLHMSVEAAEKLLADLPAAIAKAKGL